MARKHRAQGAYGSNGANCLLENPRLAVAPCANLTVCRIWCAKRAVRREICLRAPLARRTMGRDLTGALN